MSNWRHYSDVGTEARTVQCGDCGAGRSCPRGACGRLSSVVGCYWTYRSTSSRLRRQASSTSTLTCRSPIERPRCYACSPPVLPTEKSPWRSSSARRRWPVTSATSTPSSTSLHALPLPRTPMNTTSPHLHRTTHIYTAERWMVQPICSCLLAPSVDDNGLIGGRHGGHD